MRFIIYLMMIAGIDIFLKSIKDKKKIDEARRKRSQQLQKTGAGQKSSLYDISLDDILKEDKYKDEIEDIRDYQFQEDYIPFENYEFDYDKDLAIKSKKIMKGTKAVNKGVSKKGVSKEKTYKETSNLDKDILRGIIFSEILSEPKSIQNMKRRSI